MTSRTGVAEGGGGSRSGTAELDALVRGVTEGRTRAVARAISLVERGGDETAELSRRLQPATGGARLVGITGPPGAGKSTLVAALAHALRQRGERVAILAIDPTSPYSGGALLGDRVRMSELHVDPGVFIRSMATRGAVGGLARAAHDALDVLDAAGFGWVLVETVGVGQDEVDIVRCVDSVAVVTIPGLGDEIQTLKAGILEIADLFVLNKADREGIDQTARDLRMMLGLAEPREWQPPLVRTVATRGEGIGEVLAAVEAHREHLEGTGEGSRRRAARLRMRVETILQEKVLRAARERLDLEGETARGRQEGLDPYRLADRLLGSLLSSQEGR